MTIFIHFVTNWLYAYKSRRQKPRNSARLTAADEVVKLMIGEMFVCFMSVGHKQAVASDFNFCINHVEIEQSDDVKYLGVYLESKLSRKIHIEN